MVANVVMMLQAVAFMCKAAKNRALCLQIYIVGCKVAFEFFEMAFKNCLDSRFEFEVSIFLLVKEQLLNSDLSKSEALTKMKLHAIFIFLGRLCFGRMSLLTFHSSSWLIHSRSLAQVPHTVAVTPLVTSN